MHPQIYGKAIIGCLPGGHPDVQLQTVFIVWRLERSIPTSSLGYGQGRVFRLRTWSTELLSGVRFLISVTLLDQSRSQVVHTYT